MPCPSPAAAGLPRGTELERLRAVPGPAIAEAGTRAALWRDAGIVRCAEGLRGLLGDPNPLARLVARCALERAESRGAHQRSDHPDRHPQLDYRHVVVAAARPTSPGRPGTRGPPGRGPS